MANPDAGAQLVLLLEQLRNANAQYAAEQLGSNRGQRHQQWRSIVDSLIPQLLATVNDLARGASKAEA